MNNFLEFISMQNPNVRYVVLGSVLFAVGSALVGCFAFLRKRSLVGDAVAHSVLPGICLAFILFNTKNLLVLLAGATVTGWISLWAIDVITGRSRIKADSAIGLVLSVFFGLGILMLTFIQNSGNAAQAGLSSFLFGNAAAIIKQDVITFAVISGLLVGVVIAFYKEFKIVAFDRDYAMAIGLPVRTIELVLSIITVLAVAVGIQAVGVVLMAAMLITPAAAARYWTDKLGIMIVLAVVFAIMSSITGAYVSYTDSNMPTGPWIIVVISTIAIFSLAVAPKKGMLSRYLRRLQMQRKILDENILKIFYHLGEKDGNFPAPRLLKELQQKRFIDTSKLKEGLARLKKGGFVRSTGSSVELTDEGFLKAKRIIRIHRLWELYLTTYLRIADDHVHEDAEAIEHVITPEIEQRLEELLDFPDKDPHGKDIRYVG